MLAVSAFFGIFLKKFLLSFPEILSIKGVGGDSDSTVGTALPSVNIKALLNYSFLRLICGLNLENGMTGWGKV